MAGLRSTQIAGDVHDRDEASGKCTMPSPAAKRHLRHVTPGAPQVGLRAFACDCLPAPAPGAAQVATHAPALASITAPGLGHDGPFPAAGDISRTASASAAGAAAVGAPAAEAAPASPSATAATPGGSEPGAGAGTSSSDGGAAALSPDDYMATLPALGTFLEQPCTARRVPTAMCMLFVWHVYGVRMGCVCGC